MRRDSRGKSSTISRITLVPIMFALTLVGWGTPALAKTMDSVVILDESSPLTLGSSDAEQEVLAQNEDNDPVNPSQKVNIEDTSITVYGAVYTGDELRAVVDVTYNGEYLTEGLDYQVAYKDSHTDAGESTIEIRGTGDRFEGSTERTFFIQSKQVNPKVMLAETSYTYDGSQKTPTINVNDEEKLLVKDVDYSLEYDPGRVNPGTYTISVTLMGNYSGSGSASFTITSCPVSSAKVTGIVGKTYNGKAQTQKPVVKLGTKTLKASRDYTVAYKNNVNAGTAEVIIKGKGNYSGTLTKTFKIARRSIVKAKVTGIVGKTYNGKAQAQRPTVKLGTKTLKASRDYTVAYKNNVNAGTAKVIIKGKGNYTESITKTFTISKRNFSKAKVGKVAKQLYTGVAITPKPTVKWGKTTLVLGKDYKLSYKNNKALGTATITVTGKGNYSNATKTKTFKIYQVEAKSFSVSSIGIQDYTGSNLKPSPSITWQGRTLKKGRDYTLSYSNNRYGGWATMTITGKGSFKGSKTVKFYIDGPEYVGVTVYITNTGEKYHNAGCRFLYSSHAVDLGEAEWLGYTPCSVCH